jgi:hypothetical protein
MAVVGDMIAPVASKSLAYFFRFAARAKNVLPALTRHSRSRSRRHKRPCRRAE